jgi:hypothetical protein
MNPQISYVASFVTDKAFWAKVVGGVLLGLTAYGVKVPAIDAATQAEIVGFLTFAASFALQLWGGQGPIALTAPVSTPANQTLPPGVHTVTVTPPPVPVPPTTVTVASRPLPAPAPPPPATPPLQGLPV